MSKTQDLYARAQALIPGGTQLLSKRPELFLPGEWPAYYRSAKGVMVEDLDGRRYTDVSIHGIGACPLGFADPDVDAAAIGAIRAGSMATLSCPEEVELAERLIELHPFAQMVRYTRGGGEAMAMAVRIARASTGRERVAFSGYHGWHDWYLCANLGDRAALDGHLMPEIEPAGVPRALLGTTVPFAFGDPAALDALLDRHAGELAAIVVEPARYDEPPPGYLALLAEKARSAGAVLIFDEITSGFRMTVGGIHKTFGVDPDVVVFAKAIGNGYPLGAVLGRRAVMESVASTFISSTAWTERVGPTAALATIAKLTARDVPARLIAAGQRMRRGWESAATEAGVAIHTQGIAAMPSFRFDHATEQKALATLYTQGMLDRGFLASAAFYASFAHDDEVIDRALLATREVFGELADALRSGSVEGRLRGPIAWAGLRRGKVQR